MKNILIRGPLLSLSGYGFHSRQVFSWLLSRKDVKIHCQILPWGSTTWLVESSLENGLIGEVLERIVSEEQIPTINFDESYQIQLPNEWIKVSSFDVGITAGIETSKCSLGWLHDINKMKKVIVPSEFTKKVFLNTSNESNIKLQTDITVIPEYFHEDFLKDTKKSNISTHLNVINQDINFLMVCQLTEINPSFDRKNILFTIKNTLEFLSKKPGKTYSIVLKTNLGKNTSLDFEHVKKIFKNFLDSFDYDKENIKVHILHGSLDAKDMKELYNHKNIDCYLTCTRGEGYGLPILEAASQGLPVIATNWSGHLDFLENSSFIPVNYTLDSIPLNKVDGMLFVRGSKWANFLPESLDSSLEKFIKKRNKYKKLAQDNAKLIKKNYSKLSVFNQYNKFLSKT